MSGFVVTCILGGYKPGRAEIIRMLDLSDFLLTQDQDTSHPVSEGSTNTRLIDQIKNENIQNREQSNFSVLGGNRSSEILFIKSSSRHSVIDIYNNIISTPRRVKYIRRIIPVMSIFTLSLDNLSLEAEKLTKYIDSTETFAISLKKRLCSHIGTDTIITAVANKLPFKVDLSNPDKLVVIEIAKDLCAIGVLIPCPSNFNLSRTPKQQPNLSNTN
ncbi:tRNA acetyltransferase TAN1 [Nematocida sp. AWRm80]|nr:tRNA acetyltransferase TAN1 [Nematocida sp. AWRm80]